MKILCLALMVPFTLKGAITNYTFSGYINYVDPEISAYVPFSEFGDTFSGSFTLDDSVEAGFLGTNFSSFPAAITAFEIYFDAFDGGFASEEGDVLNADNGTNHQFSFDTYPGSTFGGFDDYYEEYFSPEDDPFGDGTTEIYVYLNDLFFFAGDTDSSLFTENPPEAITPNPADFEHLYIDLAYYLESYDEEGNQTSFSDEPYYVGLEVTSFESDFIGVIPEPRMFSVIVGAFAGILLATRRRL